MTPVVEKLTVIAAIIIMAGALIVMALLGGCGFRSTDEGRVRMPIAGGRCELIVDDNVGGPLPRTGPHTAAADAYGVSCDLWRW